MSIEQGRECLRQVTFSSCFYVFASSDLDKYFKKLEATQKFVLIVVHFGPILVRSTEVSVDLSCIYFIFVQNGGLLDEFKEWTSLKIRSLT